MKKKIIKRIKFLKRKPLRYFYFISLLLKFILHLFILLITYYYLFYLFVRKNESVEHFMWHHLMQPTRRK